MGELVVGLDDPEAADVGALLGQHLAFARRHSPPEDVHALDIAELLAENVSFFSIRESGEVVGVGAIKQLDDLHAELKSMHTAQAARGRGVGRTMLDHLLGVARARGCRRVSLETGSMAAFAPARALYASAGFETCEPFAQYRPSPNSVFMTLPLDGRDEDGGWETWRWDGSLFAGAARYYVQGRLPYAESLADVLVDALGLDRRGRLLDVGCGPGVVALRLAHLFEEAVGLDPDADMLAEAARLARRQGVSNATWVRLRAEELPGGLGTFRTVTFAASFHWLDRPAVAGAVRTMLEPGGAVVQVHAPAYRSQGREGEEGAELPHPPPPDDAIVELRRRYLGPDTRAGQGIRNTSPSGEDAVFRAAGFAPARRVIVPDGRIFERTVDDLVAMRFSSSPSAPHLFGGRVAEFEADLRRLLADASPSGRFSVRLPDNIVSIWVPR